MTTEEECMSAEREVETRVSWNLDEIETAFSDTFYERGEISFRKTGAEKEKTWVLNRVFHDMIENLYALKSQHDTSRTTKT